MKRLVMAAASLWLILSLVSLTGWAQKPVYVGAKKCKGCHTGAKKGNVFSKWQAFKHAKAFETLKAKGQEKNPRCLSCHTTGFNEGGYKLGDPNAAKFEGVQCEACHGAGSLYMKVNHMKDMGDAIEKGLILPMESLCIKCHNKTCPDFKGFKYASYIKQITHPYKN